MSRSAVISEDIIQQSIGKEMGLSLSEASNLIQIIKVDEKDALKPGENHAGRLRELTVEALLKKNEEEELNPNLALAEAPTKSTHQFIVKLMPTGAMAHLVDEMCFFDIEINAYNKLLPTLFSMEETRGRSISIPKVFYGCVKKGILVMENLKESGFSVVDGLKGFDLEQARLALDNLATLHVTSYHFIQTYAGGIEKFQVEYPIMEKLFWIGGGNSSIEKLMDYVVIEMGTAALSVVAELGNTISPAFIQKMKTTLANSKQILNDTLTFNENHFNCINHSDPRINNFMFRTVDGKLQVKLIDFQMFLYNRPSIDLAYFLGANLTPEFRRTHLVDLLKHYHENLSSQLRQFGYNPDEVYSWEHLNQDLKECRLFMLLEAVMMANMSIYDEPLNLDPTPEGLAQYHEQIMHNAAEYEPLRQRLTALLNEAFESDFFRGLF